MGDLASHPGDKDKSVARARHPELVWRLRDTLAAALLFLGSAAFTWWQNTRVAVLWDLGYLLDISWRIALGQMPYRDFPLVHAPATFFIQAGLIELFGRHYLVTIIYVAVMGGVGTVMAWRILLRTMRCVGDRRHVWLVSLLLAAPLVVVGVYAIYPHPIYDCDCALAILVALLLLVRLDEEARGWIRPFCAGAACVLPLFCKQNMGLPFLAVIAAAMVALLIAQGIQARSLDELLRSPYAFVLAGMAAAVALALILIAATAGLHNYIYWTMTFAAQKRMPGVGSMLATYAQPSFAWTVPALAAGLLLCSTRFVEKRWGKLAAYALIAAPFTWSLIYLLLQDDADERADNLLALWPLWMLVSLVVELIGLRRGVTLSRLMPFIVLAAIHGTFLSQQLWGSTYAIWPLLLVLIAGVLAVLTRPAWPVCIAVAATVCVTFAVCGGFYAASLERLNYIDIPDGPIQHSTTPALRGMAGPGPYLHNFDELIEFAGREIPASDALLLFPGEDPFYYATGRAPQFPITLFDPATDPYTPAQLLDEARRRRVRWVIVKRILQSKANAMPQSGPTMRLIANEFALYRELNGYDVYRRR